MGTQPQHFLLHHFTCAPLVLSISDVFLVCIVNEYLCLSRRRLRFDSPTRRQGLPWWCSGKESVCQCKRREFSPWGRKVPWRRKRLPAPVFWHGKSPPCCRCSLNWVKRTGLGRHKALLQASFDGMEFWRRRSTPLPRCLDCNTCKWHGWVELQMEFVLLTIWPWDGKIILDYLWSCDHWAFVSERRRQESQSQGGEGTLKQG